MAKKKIRDNPSKPDTFRTTPFNSLKGVSVPAPPVPPSKPEPPRPPAPPAPVAADDAALFLQAMNGVNRVGKRQAAGGTEAGTLKRNPASPTTKRVVEVDAVERETFVLAIDQLKLDKTFVDQLPEDDELKPLGANRLRQLKRGIISVERQLDLHGLNREEALDALPRFLSSARAHKEKAVLIITGKGYNSPGEPVLQQAVAGWLRDAGRQFVVEYAPAPREMGGSGAFVVFLRN